MNRNQNRSWTKAVKVFKLQALQKQHRKATAEFCKEPPMHSCPGKKVNKSCGSNSSCITRSTVQSPVLKDRRARSLLHMGYSDWTDPTPKWFQMGQGSQRVAVPPLLSYSSSPYSAHQWLVPCHTSSYLLIELLHWAWSWLIHPGWDSHLIKNKLIRETERARTHNVLSSLITTLVKSFLNSQF